MLGRVLARVRGGVEWSAPYRRRYGALRGTRLAVAARRLCYAGAPGELVRLPVPGLPHPLLGRARTADGAVFQQHFMFEELAGDLPARARVVVDAGANVGYSAVWFALRYPGARIVCLEVEPSNLALLRRNTAGLPGVELVEAGLWGHVARLAIADPSAAANAFRVVEAPDGPIPALGVADLLERIGAESIDVLKIDIEGAEVEVFEEGSARWLDRVEVLLVELHDALRPGCTAALDRALQGRPFQRSRSGEYTVARRLPAHANPKARP
ncbi:MAG TPA: FkbM family methyltransferase [Gemmatimonadales bacterium]|nr:FkbM family methyltransferase [Gemmatimonadales bacterium]